MDTSTQYGKAIQFGVTSVAGTSGVVKSATVKFQNQVKELVGGDGNPVTVQVYKPTGEATVELALPLDAEITEAESTVKTFLAAVAKEAGWSSGTVVVSSIDKTESSEDFVSYSATATIYPTVVSATE